MNLCGAFENCNYSSRENTSERKRTIQKVYTQLLGQKFAESKTVSMPEQNCMQKLIHFYRAHDARTEHMDKVFFETLAHIFLNVGNSMEDVWELHRDISDACDEEGTLRKLSGLCRNILSGKKSLDYKYEDCYTRNRIRRWRVFHPDSLLVWRSPDISQLTSMLSSGSLEYDDAYEKRLQKKSEDVSRKEENENGMGDEYDEDVTIFFRKRKAKRQKVEPSDEKEKVPAYISQDATAEEIDEIQKKIYLVGVPETIYELLPTTDHAVQAVFLRAGAPRDVFELTNFEIPIGSEPNGKKVSRDDSNGRGGVHPQGACDFDGALGILQKKLDCPNGRDETDLPMDTERVSSSGSSEGGVESSNPFITAPVHADRGGMRRKKRNNRDKTDDGAKQDKESDNEESEGSDEEEDEESYEEVFTSEEDIEVSSGTSQESSSNEEEDTEGSSGTSQESSGDEEEDEESDEEEDEEDQEEDEEDQEEDEEDQEEDEEDEDEE